MPYISEVASIYIQRFYTGWITLRNQLATPIKLMGRRVIELYDALIAGNDFEVTPYLSLKRRAGHTAYVTINYPAMLLRSWKSNTQGTIPIIDTTGDIEYVNSSGTTSVIATKGATTGSGLESSVLGIGNYLYVGNPQQSFKWDGPSGPQGETNWGISIGASSVGPTVAGTGGQVSSGGTTWSNTSNVTGSSGYATATITSGAHNESNVLTATNYSFSVPAGANITSVTVTFTAYETGSTGGTLSFACAMTADGINELTGTHPILQTSPTGYSFTFPNKANLFTPTITNASTFGVLFQGSIGGSGLSVVLSVQNVKLTVNYGPLPIVTGSGNGPQGSGTLTTVNGWVYVYAYGNSVSGEISNATLPSTVVGPFSSKSYVGVGVTASTDSQVNQIRVYRTTDSGGGNQYFEIANSPFANATTTIQDSTPDTSLQVTSQAEINLGNTPPPVGLVNLEWFAGRTWGSSTNLLFASTGPETLSGTAPNSNWNPLYQWVIPGTIERNITGPNGMLVFTQDECYIVRGTDITNYTVNLFVKDFGVRSYNAVDTDGTNLYVFTSDRQFILVSASGAQDIGLPIGDQLLNVDPTQCYVSVNRYGLDSIVRILDTVNNVYYDYNLNQQCWNLPGILKMPDCTAMGSIEVSPGVWRLLLCSTSSGVSQLAYRDITNFQDLGTSYAPNAVFGSIQMADPGTSVKFGARAGITLEYLKAGSLPTLSVLPNDIGATLSNAVGSQITGTFVDLSVPGNPQTDPAVLGQQPTNYRCLWYQWALGKALSSYIKHFQFQISAIAENTATELIGFCIFGDQKQEVETPGQIPQIQGR